MERTALSSSRPARALRWAMALPPVMEGRREMGKMQNGMESTACPFNLRAFVRAAPLLHARRSISLNLRF